jgi:CheY-like chemotaxis protein/HPt (histidine-containing phosphotransfer) domain-containing protein
VPDPSLRNGAGSEQSRRALIADDNVINQRVAAAMLRHLGFDVDVVADGADAVEAAMLTPYRIILMDCQIPGLDGYQATAEIRRLQGPSRRTPIVAVTGSASMSDEKRCLAAGMDGFLSKPLRLRSLGAALARWVPQAATGDAADDPARPVRTGAASSVRGADPGGAVLDAVVLARLQRLGAASGEDLLGQLAALFLSDAALRIETLRQAIVEGDTEEVFRSAHFLAGSSANLGATDLSRLCSVLAARADDRAHRRAMADGIEAELELVRAALGAPVPAG